MNHPTDTEMLEWLIAHGYAPAKWREPETPEEREMLAHTAAPSLILAGPASRETIRLAMAREKKQDAQA